MHGACTSDIQQVRAQREFLSGASRSKTYAYSSWPRRRLQSYLVERSLVHRWLPYKDLQMERGISPWWGILRNSSLGFLPKSSHLPFWQKMSFFYWEAFWQPSYYRCSKDGPFTPKCCEDVCKDRSTKVSSSKDLAGMRRDFAWSLARSSLWKDPKVLQALPSPWTWCYSL